MRFANLHFVAGARTPDLRKPALGLSMGLVLSALACDGGQAIAVQNSVVHDVAASDQDVPKMQPIEARGLDVAASPEEVGVPNPVPDFQDADNPAQNARAWRAAQLGMGSSSQTAATENTRDSDDGDATAQSNAPGASTASRRPAAKQIDTPPIHKSDLPSGREDMNLPRRDVRRVDLMPSAPVPNTLDENGRPLGAVPEASPRIQHRNLPAQSDLSDIDVNGRIRLR